jgi:hypothetical protein
MKDVGNLTCEIKEGQALRFEIPVQFLADLARRGIDQAPLCVTVTSVKKLGRMSRLEIKAPHAVKIIKP